MIFHETKLKGAYIIELEKMEDERGFFARSYCRKEFEAHGINFKIVQCNISFNEKKGTLRGMHYQKPPYCEEKLVCCVSGAIYDVIIDLRSSSASFGKWFSAKLTQANNKMVYIPKGFAHGFQTLENKTTVSYQMSEFYHPECAQGLRYNDPKLKIPWPYSKGILSPKDKSYPSIENFNS